MPRELFAAAGKLSTSGAAQRPPLRSRLALDPLELACLKVVRAHPAARLRGQLASAHALCAAQTARSQRL